MNKKLAELLGIIAGDGCLSNRKQKYVLYIAGHKIDDLDYHEKTTKRLLKELFNKDAKINFKTGERTLFIRFSDKNVFNELKEYLPVGKKYDGLRLPPEIIKSRGYFFAFTRGLADTDGCVVFSKQHRSEAYYPRIEITSKSKIFLNNLLSELKKSGFYGSVSFKSKQAFRLELPGAKNLKMWLQKVGFSNQKHIRKIESRFHAAF